MFTKFYHKAEPKHMLKNLHHTKKITIILPSKYVQNHYLAQLPAVDSYKHSLSNKSPFAIIFFLLFLGLHAGQDENCFESWTIKIAMKKKMDKSFRDIYTCFSYPLIERKVRSYPDRNKLNRKLSAKVNIGRNSRKFI